MMRQQSLPAIEQHISAGGARLYRLPLQVFPGFVAYAVVVLERGEPTLIDVGSGLGDSTEQLVAGIDALRSDFGEKVTLGDIRRIFITHGHIDHSGGVTAMQALTGARIGVHPLDRRVITDYSERLIISTAALRAFLERAGVAAEERALMLDMYNITKRQVGSTTADFALDDGETIDGMTFLHVPGHCPGMVCIRIDDLLLTADQLLPRTIPHLAPESITPYTGLGHYFESLDKLEALEGVRLALGGHEEPMPDLRARVRETRQNYRDRLDRLQMILQTHGEPMTIADLTRSIYPRLRGYDTLLAVEKVGAQVEYLYDRGLLSIANLDAIEAQTPAPILYAPAW